MSFISSALLWALPLASVPIILHLLYRWRRRPVMFGDNFLLAEVVARVMPRRRLEEWLLTLIRAALAALLILAFARPVLHWGFGSPASDKEALDVVVLLDDSYSMGMVSGGRARFERAKEIASQLLSSLRPQDRASIVAFSDRVEATTGELQSGPSRLTSWLSRAALSQHGTDYRLAVESAYSILARSEASRKAIVILSDGARSGFRSWPGRSLDTLPFYDPKTRLAGVAWSDTPWNSALEGVELSGGVLKARAVLSGRPFADSDVTLWEGGRVAEKRRVLLKQGPADIAFQVSPATGIFSGRLSLRPDPLAADDSFSFAFAIEPTPKVLVLEAGTRELPTFSGAYFLKRVFTQAHLPFDAVFADPADLPTLRLRDYAAVMLLSPAGIDAAGAGLLENFTKSGGGLWVFPEDDAASVRALASMLPGRLSTLQSGSAGLLPDSAAAWKGLAFAWSDFDLPQISWSRMLLLEPRQGADVWFRSGGRPVFAEAPLGLGRVVLAASPLKSAWTNLPLKPIFAPLLAASLRELTSAGKDRVRRMLNLEEPFARSWEPPSSAPAAVTIVAPDGTSSGVPVIGGRLEYARTGQLGLYRVLADGRPQDAFAVNLDPALGEADVQREEPPPWPLFPEEEFADAFQRLLFGQEVRHIALALVLLLLLAETLLSARAARKTTAAVPAPSPREEIPA